MVTIFILLVITNQIIWLEQGNLKKGDEELCPLFK